MRTISTKYSSPTMLRFLEKLTNNKGLIGDPYYNTDYGYYHIVGPGGVLGSHVDHSHHSHLNLPHVVNIVVYLTKDWDEKDGGGLCLFGSDGKTVKKKVPCDFNSAAIFECSPVAFHGVEPIKENIDKRRHSIYFAYYSTKGANKTMTESFPQLHNGETNETARYGTYFILPFKDLLKWKNRNHFKIRIGNLLKLFIPPILFLGKKKILKGK